MRTCAVLVIADICALLLALAGAYALRTAFGGELHPERYLALLPSLLLFSAMYAGLGLYSPVLRPPHEELKWLSIATTFGFVMVAFLLFLGQKGAAYSRLFMLQAWCFALVLIPLCRWLSRKVFCRRPWWGVPVLLLAPADEGETVARDFARHPECGLVLREGVAIKLRAPSPENPDGVELAMEGGDRLFEAMRRLKARHPRAHVLIMAAGLPQAARHALFLHTGRRFKHVLVSLDSFWLKQFTLRVTDLPSGPALLLCQNLLDPMRMRFKRLLDLSFCLLGAIFLLVIIPLIILAIRLDSRGPVFFSQERLGRGGRPIRVWKFRTMVRNAPEVLERLLAENPDMAREWAATQKLTRDPRLTRVGRFLRHTSLDELPQMYNVLKGEMSLVGPRPIVENEIARYGEAYALYTRVRPGITGLWQISGRNDLSYERRVELDRQYVYNWSVWLDIYIILRTLPALLSGKGAY